MPYSNVVNPNGNSFETGFAALGDALRKRKQLEVALQSLQGISEQAFNPETADLETIKRQQELAKMISTIDPKKAAPFISLLDNRMALVNAPGMKGKREGDELASREKQVYEGKNRLATDTQAELDEMDSHEQMDTLPELEKPRMEALRMALASGRQNVAAADTSELKLDELKRQFDTQKKFSDLNKQTILEHLARNKTPFLIRKPITENDPEVEQMPDNFVQINALKAGVDPENYSRIGRLEQGDRRLSQGDRRMDISEKTQEDKNAIAQAKLAADEQEFEFRQMDRNRAHELKLKQSELPAFLQANINYRALTSKLLDPNLTLDEPTRQNLVSQRMQAKQIMTELDPSNHSQKTEQPASKGGVNGKVRVISPSGVPGMIPAEQLDTALQQGYKRAK